VRLEHGNGADGELVQAQLILGFMHASVKHHTCSTFACLFEGAHGKTTASTKL